MRGTYAELWDWRRQVAALYAYIRASDDAEVAWHHWRRSRDQLFRLHGQSPLQRAADNRFSGLRYYNYDFRLRFRVPVRPIAGEQDLTLAAGADGEVRVTPFARSDGLADALGRELTLYWIGGYGGGVFLPFRDGTSVDTTFAGGRYLLDTAKGADLGSTADGRLVLDFNFAYNPSCAYSDRFVCPLAPPENHIEQPVPAGERLAV